PGGPLARVAAGVPVVGSGPRLAVLGDHPQRLVVRGVDLSLAVVAPAIARPGEGLVVVVLARLVDEWITHRPGRVPRQVHGIACRRELARSELGEVQDD